MVQQLRRWFVDQGGEPVESGDRLAAARDDDVEMSVDEMPSDAGMSTVEYAVGTEYVHPTAAGMAYFFALALGVFFLGA